MRAIHRRFSIYDHDLSAEPPSLRGCENYLAHNLSGSKTTECADFVTRLRRFFESDSVSLGRLAAEIACGWCFICRI